MQIIICYKKIFLLGLFIYIHIYQVINCYYFFKKNLKKLINKHLFLLQILSLKEEFFNNEKNFR